MLQQPPSRPPTHRHPGKPEFCHNATCLFDLIEEHTHHFLTKSATNFRKPLEVRLKLAITLRHLATGETSRQYHRLASKSTICKFIPQVCRAIPAEFQDEYLFCPDSPKDWKKSGGEVYNQLECPHAVGTMDEKHIAMKKPKKTGSDYYNLASFS